MTKQRALIFGHTGQDGYYLSNLLRKKGYQVTGFSKNQLLVDSKTIKNKYNLQSREDINRFIKKIDPSQIYYLAAFHNSSQNNNILPTRDLYELSYKVNVEGFLNVLDAVLNYVPKCKVFYASSSHIFGNPKKYPQNEEHPINPLNIYGQSKALGMEIANYYKNNHNLFCMSGILYNHESTRRNSLFFSKKISLGIKNIIKGKLNNIEIGSLESIVDWSYVTDVVEAMFLCLSSDVPNDYIIASGKGHTTRDYIEIAFKSQGLDYKKYVRLDKKFKDKTSTAVPRVGDISSIKKFTGWKPKFSFYDMINELMRIEIYENKK